MTEQTAPAKWLISGRVQGVGFRWFVLRKAQELGVVGWARNLPDGTVEVVGAGDAPLLNRFEESLTVGPRLARVENVEKSDYPHEVDTLKSFDIR